MNEVELELESEESGDDDDSESDAVYVFLTSSGNHDDTGEDFDEADEADEADDGSALDPFLENMLNIELEADAGGFEFANDIFGCLLLLKNAKYYYIILFKYDNILYKNKLNVDLYIESQGITLSNTTQYIHIQSCHCRPISKINSQP
jgi:hypothetical protein